MGKGAKMHSVQLCLENLQWWELHNIPGEVVPVIVLAVNKFFLKMKPLPVYLLPIDLCPPHVGLYQKRVSVLFVAAPLVLKHCYKVPSKPSLLKREKTFSILSLSSEHRFPVLWLWWHFGLYPVCLSLF